MSTKKCKRHGCRKQFTDDQNSETACGFHPGKPIFHDTKKGWTCCNKIVYDWDQFQKLPTCAVGTHSDKKPEEQQQFYKSSTVTNAANALKKQQQKIVIKDINKYNEEFNAKKKKQEEEKAQAGTQKQLFYTKKGNLKCINQGCGKQFQQGENNQNACEFHKGLPVFHDCKKYWTCCGKQTMDWDEFMKLPKCCLGFHSPKYKQ